MRAHLGLETTQGRGERTVTQAAPCLFGLYTAVALMVEATPEGERTGRVDWPGKATVTFPDALAACGDGRGPKEFCHRSGVGRVLRNSPTACGNYCSPRWRRPRENSQIGTSRAKQYTC